jgi:hypothetical protein
LKKLGIPVKVENTVAKIHHKVGINDENVIMITKRQIAEFFLPNLSWNCGKMFWLNK